MLVVSIVGLIVYGCLIYALGSFLMRSEAPPDYPKLTEKEQRELSRTLKHPRIADDIH